MTRDEIEKRLRDHEDNFVERKPDNVNKADIRKALSAFANSVPVGREAVLAIGVRDNGVVQGCANTDDMQKRVREAGQECYPPITATCEVVSIEGKLVVAVIVGHSGNRPHFTGAAYIRRGSESVNATGELFDSLVHSRNSKVAAVQRLEGQIVNVIGLGHRLGQTRRDVPPAYRESGQCRVVKCDAHLVTLTRLSDMSTFSEALDRVAVGHNHERGLPELVVTGL